MKIHKINKSLNDSIVHLNMSPDKQCVQHNCYFTAKSGVILVSFGAVEEIGTIMRT